MQCDPTRRYFSIIIGAGCNAACPFCIAPPATKDANALPVDKLVDAAAIALEQGAEVASVSGGGEPLLLERLDSDAWYGVCDAISSFPKRDLHSNLSISPRIPVSDLFTHLTVSIWKDREATREYLGRDFHDRILANLLSVDVPLRLSAVLGSDWCRGPEDLDEYLALASQVGAQQVTLREMQPANHSDQAWMSARHLDGEIAEEWLAELGSRDGATVRDSPVYEVRGIEVCVYHYAPDGEDSDFLYFRPDMNGEYGLFSDYDNDEFMLEGLG